MERSKQRSTPPTSRRSNINLADLRLSPLSTRYAEPPKASIIINDDPYDLSFTTSHSSYIQGKSAPTSPGILSRSSSRKNLGAGLRRRSSLYDDDVQLGTEGGTQDLEGVVRSEKRSARLEVGGAQIPKAKSEAALLVHRSKLASQSVQFIGYQKQPSTRSRTGDSGRAIPKTKLKGVDEDWLTRTGAAANAILQESKGQSWIASRASSTSLTHLQDTTDEEDEGYEELAAQSASTSRRQLVDDELSPVSTRASRWGSRYGSRTASRRTSRRGSMTTIAATRTPFAQQGAEDYFEDAAAAMAMEPDFLDGDEDVDTDDEAALRQLTESRSFGIGGFVERIMNFSLFNVEEREEVTEDEADRSGETAEQAKERMAAENKRKREEKEKLVSRSGQVERGENADQREGGWADAAWLLSVASKAIF